jgi:cytochrome b6-f complex iron-sulfur subunit
MADEKTRPSVADILAMARAEKAKGETPPPAPVAETPAETTSAEATAPAGGPTKAPDTQAAGAKSGPAKPAPAKPAATGAGGARPSVAEMLAMARAQKAGGEPAAKPAAVPAAAKPAAKPADQAAKLAAEKPAAKPSAAKPPAKPTAAAVRDTSSILAAARAGTKPGPVPKSQAPVAVKEKPAAAAKPRVVVAPMPAKPDYAKPKPAKAAGTEDRRGFLSLLLGSAFALGNTSLALATGLMTLGTARFMFPNILTEPPSRFKVGFPDNFAPGQVETKFVAQFGVWVVNGEYNGKREIYALRTVCTHLGCTPNWLEGEQKFKCPCHGSGFYKDGINFEGPAPRPLERYAIRLGDDGQIEIDKSKTFQEELGQWNDPASFVVV